MWDVSTALDTGVARPQPLQTFKGHTSFVWDVLFSPDGRYLASASGDTTARIWDTDSGEIVARLKHGHPVADVAWSHSGNILASTSDDGVVYLWDVSSHKLLGVLTGHHGGVWSVTWSPDDARLATAAADGLLRIFHTDFKKILALAREYKRRELTKAEREQFMGEPVFGETLRL